jgi:O-antigen biosynthesis protein WbqP
MPLYKRAFDVVCSILLIVFFSPLLAAVAVAVKMTSRGSILHWSHRVGQGNRIFRMPKFRSMLIDTPQLATHLLSDPSKYLTPIGAFLRKTSLDELPQLFSVVAGDLSLVGPRPALFNQHDLIELRTQHGVDVLVPGITGWAQINGRDELPIPVKVRFDSEYLQRQSFAFDLKILLTTPKKVALCEGTSHRGIGATSHPRSFWGNRRIQRTKQSKLRIWFVSELYYPEMTSTGYFMTEIAEGVASEYDVSALCSRPTYLARGTETKPHEVVNGVHIHRCWGTVLDKNRLFFKIVNAFTIATSLFVNALLRVRSKDIVVVVTNPPVLPYLIALACKLKKARFILRVDDVYPELLTRFGFLKSGSVAERMLDSASRWLYRIS